jgi:hypothetical protein
LKEFVFECNWSFALAYFEDALNLFLISHSLFPLLLLLLPATLSLSSSSSLPSLSLPSSLSPVCPPSLFSLLFT